VFGAGGGTSSYREIEDTDLVILWGSNARETHPIFFHHLLKGLRNGARLIVIDPRRTSSARWADLWLGLEVGSDIALANAIGTGVADDKAVFAYVPAIIRYYLDQDPILENVETFLMSDQGQRQHVLSRLQDYVVKAVGESGGYGMLIGPHSTAAQRDDFDPKLILLVRRVRVRPTLIFQGRVTEDPVAKAVATAKPAGPKPSASAPAAQPKDDSVVGRVRAFLRNLFS